MARRFRVLLPLLLGGCTIHHVQPYHAETAPAPDTADAAASSTNCFEASTVAEHLACASPALAALNRTLAETWQADLRVADPFGRDTLIAVQRQWLLSLPGACHVSDAPARGDAISCLAEQFRQQIALLASWHRPAPPAPATAQYVHFRPAPGATALNPAFCTVLAGDLNIALEHTGTADPAAIPRAVEIAGTHGAPAADLGGQRVQVDLRLANAFGGFAQRARGISIGGTPVLDSLSLGKLLQANAENQGARFSAYASQTGDYGSADVFSYRGQTVALLADSFGFYTPAAPGEFAHAGAWSLAGGAASPLCLFQTFQMPADDTAFATLPSFAPWRDALVAIHGDATADLGVSFLRDQGQLRSETNWLLLHMPLVASEQARAGNWIPWLRLRHDQVLDALFAWAAQDASRKPRFDRVFALLRPAAQDLVRAYQQTEALSGQEAKDAAGLTVMELLYSATLTLAPALAPALGADLQAPASAMGQKPRYPILAAPQ